MKYVKLTDPPQKVRIAAMGGGTCLQFPCLDVFLEGYEVNVVIDAEAPTGRNRIRLLNTSTPL